MMFRLHTQSGHTHTERGFSFIDVLIAAALIGLFFVGIFGTVQFIVKLIVQTKAQTGALAIANERIERIRSQTYSNIGTVSGIPSGTTPQNATTSLNGLTYSIRTLIEYIDVADDGLGGADLNGIVADMKQAKVEVSWNSGYGTTSVSLITQVAPPGIETTAGGGTLTVNVFDAQVAPLSGIPVRVYNNTTTTTIDVTKSTNASGTAMFSGAPAAANYEITVTDTGYSTDGTYAPTTTLPNPATPPVAVALGAVSTMNFQVDRLSDLTIRTISPAVYDSFTDTFTDGALVASSSNVTVGSGEVILAGAPGSYALLGRVLSTSTAPTTFTRWTTVTWAGTTSPQTPLYIRVYSVTGTSTYTLIPDSDLPGNSTGFTTTVIDLEDLDPSTYPALALEGVLTTTNANATSRLGSWTLGYVTSEPAVPNVAFAIQGSKTIGTDLALVPIPKYARSTTTNGSGIRALSSIEWDAYSVSLTSGAYDIGEACPSLPFTLLPHTNETLTLTVVPSTAYALRVEVVDGSGNAIPYASVTLSRPGFSDTLTASPCGQVFFNTGLTVASDYDLLVSATGYSTKSVIGVNIDGQALQRVTLTP